MFGEKEIEGKSERERKSREDFLGESDLSLDLEIENELRSLRERKREKSRERKIKS